MHTHANIRMHAGTHMHTAHTRTQHTHTAHMHTLYYNCFLRSNKNKIIYHITYLSVHKTLVMYTTFLLVHSDYRRCIHLEWDTASTHSNAYFHNVIMYNTYILTYLINAHCYTEVLLHSMFDESLSIHHQL